MHVLRRNVPIAPPPRAPLLQHATSQRDSGSPIPFNRSYMVGTELEYIRQANANLRLAGDGQFTALCNWWLERHVGCHTALLTPSCTAALEMAAILIDVRPGDEIVMPSYTFVSTANAFALRGGIPVFVDVRPDTLNIDESKIEAAITTRTKAIVVVHYAGVACEMEAIMSIAQRHGLLVIEDAAQSLLSSFNGQPLGNIGHLGAVSFHETKNITCGEGGALLINDSAFTERARIIREKGTDRSKYLQGFISKYTWLDIGSSYLPSEITAAYLWGQMEAGEEITRQRLHIWSQYDQSFAAAEQQGRLRRPVIPPECTANGHMYYILLPEGTPRGQFIAGLADRGIMAVSHYVALHESVAGRRYGRCAEELVHTVGLSDRLVRLPLWIGLEREQHRVIEAVLDVLA